MKHVEYFNIKFLVTNITKRLFSLCWQILQNAPQNKLIKTVKKNPKKTTVDNIFGPTALEESHHSA